MSERHVMNVSLTGPLSRMVRSRVKSGSYASASEVVREALRLMIERDKLRASDLKRARGLIKEGLDELNRGRGVPAAEVFADARQKLGRRRKGHAA